MIIEMFMKNELGEFHSERMNVTSKQYLEMIEFSKKFYTAENGFEMWLENGFLVVPPEITKKSILIINIIEYDEDDEK